MERTLTSIVQNIVLSTDKAREIAHKIDKPYPTMMRELNPFDISAKLSITTVVAIIEITGDISPVEFMAEELGYRIDKNK